MKKLSIKITLLSFLVVGFAAQAQKKAVSNNNIAKAVDPALEAKRKVAAEELAKLPKPYHPEENATEKIAEMVKKAKSEKKNVLIQGGGNWCIWCLRFNKFVEDTPELKKLVDDNFLYYHLNTSKENKNTEVFAKYGSPGEKFGYPVFMILDKNGTLIHVQDSSVLEEGKGYNKDKIATFFKEWMPKS